MASSLHSKLAEALNSMVNTLSFNSLHGSDDKRRDRTTVNQLPSAVRATHRGRGGRPQD
jgi:hypothetical protein